MAILPTEGVGTHGDAHGGISGLNFMHTISWLILMEHRGRGGHPLTPRPPKSCMKAWLVSGGVCVLPQKLPLRDLQLHECPAHLQAHSGQRLWGHLQPLLSLGPMRGPSTNRAQVHASVPSKATGLSAALHRRKTRSDSYWLPVSPGEGPWPPGPGTTTIPISFAGLCP